jgi:hypothetical protein
MNKRAQEGRNDLIMLYGICIVIVLASVGLLYGLGFIGGYESRSSLIENNEITAAAVAVPIEDTEQINETSNDISTTTDGK